MTSAVTLCAGAVTWNVLWGKYYFVESGADEVHFAATADGWRLALSRYRAATGRRNHPVLLCHGLGANRVGFDLAPEVSLARYLAQEGFDTWVLELRGHGLSHAPSLFNRRRYGWSVDDYLQWDLPAVIEYVLGQSGADRLHWIGHSMGGILLYSHLAQGGSPKICSGITVGSSLDYSQSPSDFHRLLSFQWLARLLAGLPAGALSRFFAPLAGRLANRIERFLLWPENVEPLLIRRLLANAFHTISSPVLLQLATGFQQGGLRSRDGTVRYLDGLSSATTPVLGLAGDQDKQCAPAAVQRPLEALGPRGEYLLCGKEAGHQEHYGHFDILIGRHAPREIFPSLLDWLQNHDPT